MNSNQAIATAFRTRLGWMAMLGSGESLSYLVIGHASQAVALHALSQLTSAPLTPGKWNRPLADLLRAYAEGEAIDFDHVELELVHLTRFQLRIVQLCRRIPRGGTLTYGELAERAGAPGAARAVGNVMRTNRFPIIVPCHRVVAAGGGLGGFSAPQGISLKRRMLEMEAAPVRPTRRQALALAT
jgi:methylated-DNA-[protein]-cysteine S-methyltransferase